jgi:hypothetical protein
MAAVLKRVEREGDLFEPVLRGGQSLGAALRSLERHSAAQAAARRPSQSGVRRT